MWRTPLDITVHRGDYTAIRLLIIHSVDIKAVNGSQRITALYRAYLKGDYKAVKILLKASVLVDRRERHKWCAFNYTVTYHVKDPSKLLSLLLRYGADVIAELDFGWQPLGHAVT